MLYRIFLIFFILLSTVARADWPYLCIGDSGLDFTLQVAPDYSVILKQFYGKDSFSGTTATGFVGTKTALSVIADHLQISGISRFGQKQDLSAALFSPSTWKPGSDKGTWIVRYWNDDGATAGSAKDNYWEAKLSCLKIAKINSDLGDLTNKLFQTVADGDARKVKSALEEGANQNVKRNWGPSFFSSTQTPLMLAMTNGAHEVVDVLLAHGDIDHDITNYPSLQNVLDVAAETKFLNVVEESVTDGSTDEVTKRVNHIHTFGGSSLSSASALSKEGKEAVAVTILEKLLKAGGKQSLNKDGAHSPLHTSAGSRYGSYELSKVLLAHGADVDGLIESERPLVRAANVGNTKTVELLLNKGADPNIVNGMYGYTALHAVASRCWSFKDRSQGAEIARLLLADPRTDVNAKYFDETPLARLLDHGGALACPDLVKVLKDAGGKE